MKSKALNACRNLLAYSLLFVLPLSLAACEGKASLPVPTAIRTPSISAPTVPPTASPTPTSTPLPKEPVLFSIIGRGEVYDTAWSPDRQTFAVAASDAVRVYQAKTYKV